MVLAPAAKRNVHFPKAKGGEGVPQARRRSARPVSTLHSDRRFGRCLRLACNALEKTFAEAKVKNCSGYFGFDAFAAEFCTLEARDEGGRPVARHIHKAVSLADIDAA